MRKLLLFVLVVIALFLALGNYYYYLTGDFRSENILTESFEDYSEDPSLKPILYQPYHFLDHGNQTYAFISADNKYVLKLFKKDTIDRSWISKIFPPIYPTKSWVIRKGEERINKARRIFNGYRLAYTLDKENTGLIYIHLTPTQNQFRLITVTDRFGLKHTIDLDRAIFAIQEKAIPTKTVLKENPSKTDQILELYRSEYQKGLIDQDHNVLDNTGFVGDKAIRLDVGKLTYDESIKNPENYEKDLEKVRNRLKINPLPK